MALGSLIAMALSAAGMPVVDQLLVVALACLGSAWLGQSLIKAERAAAISG
jgi:hypothetical protein